MYMCHYKHVILFRAINVDIQSGDGGFISVNKCNFTSNIGQGPGGAVHLYQLSGQSTIKVKQSHFANNRVNTFCLRSSLWWLFGIS